MMKFKVLVGKHVQDGKTFSPGQKFTSEKDWEKLFPLRFKKLKKAEKPSVPITDDNIKNDDGVGGGDSSEYYYKDSTKKGYVHVYKTEGDVKITKSPILESKVEEYISGL